MPQVLMDCDPGWDDALALILLLAGNGTDVIGVTTVYGNGTLQESTDNARRLTAFARKPLLRVYPGCAASMSPQPGPPSPALRSCVLEQLPDMGPLGQDALGFIISAVKLHQRSLTVLATGPLTNIASAVASGLPYMSKLGTLVVVGGALKAGNVSPDAEFNFRADPEAANFIMRMELNTVVIPLETCEQLKITSDFLEAARRTGTRAAHLTAAIIDDQVKRGNEDALKSFYDAIGALFVLDPGLFTLKQHRARVETTGPSAGALVLSAESEQGWPVSIAESINVEGAYRRLNETLRE